MRSHVCHEPGTASPSRRTTPCTVGAELLHSSHMRASLRLTTSPLLQRSCLRPPSRHAVARTVARGSQPLRDASVGRQYGRERALGPKLISMYWGAGRVRVLVEFFEERARTGPQNRETGFLHKNPWDYKNQKMAKMSLAGGRCIVSPWMRCDVMNNEDVGRASAAWDG